MKKLSKIVALLLAGALTMLLFTACSGGGGGSSSMSEDKDAETRVMGLIQNREGAASLQNDSDMQRIAAAKLDEDLKGAFDILGYKFNGNVHVEGENEQYLIVTVTANYEFGGTLLNKLLKQIEDSDKVSSFKANINQSGNGLRLVSLSRLTPATSRVLLQSHLRLRTLTITKTSKNSSPFLPGAQLQGRPPGLSASKERTYLPENNWKI